MSFEEQKKNLIDEGENLIQEIDANVDYLLVFRHYQKWYTQSIDFVSSHTKPREKEFREVYDEIKKSLFTTNPIFTKVKYYITLQIAMIEGSSYKGPAGEYIYFEPDENKKRLFPRE